MYSEPQPQIQVDQPEIPRGSVHQPGQRGLHRRAGRDRPEPASCPKRPGRRDRPRRSSKGRLSPSPARSRSGVEAARIPCSKASSTRPRDRVRSVSSAFPLSALSARKPRVWLPVQAMTVTVMAAATSRPARQTLLAGQPHQGDVPRKIDELLQGQSADPGAHMATTRSTAIPARKGQSTSMLGTAWGEESVSPEHQRRNASEAIAAGFAGPPPGPRPGGRGRLAANGLGPEQRYRQSTHGAPIPFEQEETEQAPHAASSDRVAAFATATLEPRPNLRRLYSAAPRRSQPVRTAGLPSNRAAWPTGMHIHRVMVDGFIKNDCVREISLVPAPRIGHINGREIMSSRTRRSRNAQGTSPVARERGFVRSHDQSAAPGARLHALVS